MRWLVTGGVGFIGTNLVKHLLDHGHDVVIADDMSRAGVDLNAAVLKDAYGIAPFPIDVSEGRELARFLEGHQRFDAIAHLAGQVSLLDSIRDPMRDFAINALGTLNLLDHVRTKSPETVIIGMSSNKIYGDLTRVRIEEAATRYVAPDWLDGFDESLPIDFHGPYGCSKGIADQYLADFSRTYGLRTASLRQSSVYGPHQHPRSDQGWVAHLVTEAVEGREIQLNGVGKQVRDLIHAADLAKLFVALAETVQPHVANQFNVGGGPTNTMSILELFDWVERRTGREVRYTTGQERPSDQKVFVSDNRAVEHLSGWSVETELEVGLSQLLDAVMSSKRANG